VDASHQQLIGQESYMASAPSEREVKQQLVDAIRMLERAGIIDYNGHCSVRVGEDRLFINSGASVRGKLTVEDIVCIDLDGKLIGGDLSGAPRREGGGAYASALVDLSVDDWHALQAGLCARRAAR
jgi:hypothetical protein